MHRYRIKKFPTGWEPQMLYTCGLVDGRRWFPLAPTGYWADPDAFSYGVIRVRSIMPNRADAERAISRARLINENRPLISSAAD